MGKGGHAFAADALSLVNGKFNANSKKERIEIASDLIKKIEEINAYLPTQKPSEVELVKKEEEAIKTENPSAVARRLNNLIFSPEYNYYKFKKLLSDTIESLECTKSKDNGLEKEILCWEIIVKNFSYNRSIDSAIDILIRNHRLPKDIFEKTILGSEKIPSNIFNGYAQSIKKYIVYPYLANRFTE
jgi:hypothetical protein